MLRERSRGTRPIVINTPPVYGDIATVRPHGRGGVAGCDYQPMLKASRWLAVEGRKNHHKKDDKMKSDKKKCGSEQVKEVPILEGDWNTFYARILEGTPCAVKNCTHKYTALEFDGKNLVVNHFGVRASIPLSKNNIVNTLHSEPDASGGTVYIRWHGAMLEIPLTRTDVDDLRE